MHKFNFLTINHVIQSPSDVDKKKSKSKIARQCVQHSVSLRELHTQHVTEDVFTAGVKAERRASVKHIPEKGKKFQLWRQAQLHVAEECNFVVNWLHTEHKKKERK